MRKNEVLFPSPVLSFTAKHICAAVTRYRFMTEIASPRNGVCIEIVTNTIVMMLNRLFLTVNCPKI